MQTLYDSDCFAVVHNALLVAGDPWPAHQLIGGMACKLLEAPRESICGQEGVTSFVGASRPGFEIVDKRKNTEVYLHGSWADTFQRQINAWRLNVPTQEEVEETLGGYAELAQTRLVLH